MSDTVNLFRNDILQTLFHQHIPKDSLEEQWQVDELTLAVQDGFGLTAPIQQWLEEDPLLNESSLLYRLQQTVDQLYLDKKASLGEELLQRLEKNILLQTLDNHWREHLASMDHLRQGIHWRGLAQKNPKQEYKRESFALFASMLDNIKREVTRLLCTVRLQTSNEIDALEELRRESAPHDLQFTHPLLNTLDPVPAEEVSTPDLSPRVGRNDLCPCGSTKKYKQCHGRLTASN